MIVMLLSLCSLPLQQIKLRLPSIDQDLHFVGCQEGCLLNYLSSIHNFVFKVLVQLNKGNSLCLKLPMAQTCASASQLAQAQCLWTGFSRWHKQVTVQSCSKSLGPVTYRKKYPLKNKSHFSYTKFSPVFASATNARDQKSSKISRRCPAALSFSPSQEG